MVGQAQGSIRLAYAALKKLRPQVIHNPQVLHVAFSLYSMQQIDTTITPQNSKLWLKLNSCSLARRLHRRKDKGRRSILAFLGGLRQTFPSISYIREGAGESQVTM